MSTAYMNDCEPLLCFAQQVNGYGKAGDVFLGSAEEYTVYPECSKEVDSEKKKRVENSWEIEAKKVKAETKATESAKKAEAEDVLKKLLASGVSADEILAKLK